MYILKKFKDIFKTTQPSDDWKPVFDSDSNTDDFEIKIASNNEHHNIAFEIDQIEKL